MYVAAEATYNLTHKMIASPGQHDSKMAALMFMTSDREITDPMAPGGVSTAAALQSPLTVGSVEVRTLCHPR